MCIANLVVCPRCHARGYLVTQCPAGGGRQCRHGLHVNGAFANGSVRKHGAADMLRCDVTRAACAHCAGRIYIYGVGAEMDRRGMRRSVRWG